MNGPFELAAKMRSGEVPLSAQKLRDAVDDSDALITYREVLIHAGATGPAVTDSPGAYKVLDICPICGESLGEMKPLQPTDSPISREERQRAAADLRRIADALERE